MVQNPPAKVIVTHYRSANRHRGGCWNASVPIGTREDGLPSTLTLDENLECPREKEKRRDAAVQHSCRIHAMRSRQNLLCERETFVEHRPSEGASQQCNKLFGMVQNPASLTGGSLCPIDCSSDLRRCRIGDAIVPKELMDQTERTLYVCRII